MYYDIQKMLQQIFPEEEYLNIPNTLNFSIDTLQKVVINKSLNFASCL